MAILGALSIARSGLIATGEALSVTGNNIANVNTIALQGQPLGVLRPARRRRHGQRRPRHASAGRQRVLRAGRHREHRPRDRHRDPGQRLLHRARRRRAGLHAQGQLHAQPRGLADHAGRPAAAGLRGGRGGQPGRAARPTSAFDGATQPAVADDDRRRCRTTSTPTRALLGRAFDGTDLGERVRDLELRRRPCKVFDSLGREPRPDALLLATGANAWELNVARRRRRDRAGRRATSTILGRRRPRRPSTPTARCADRSRRRRDGHVHRRASAQTIELQLRHAERPIADRRRGPRRPHAVRQRRRASPPIANGYGAGQLQSIAVSADGIVTGVFDNGESRAALSARPCGLRGAGRPDRARQRPVPRVGRLGRADGRRRPARAASAASSARDRALERRPRAGVRRPHLPAAELPGQRARHHHQRRPAERPDQHRPVILSGGRGSARLSGS